MSLPPRPKGKNGVKTSNRFSVLDDEAVENPEPDDTTDRYEKQEPPSQEAHARLFSSSPSEEGLSDPVSTRQHEASPLPADDLRPVRHEQLAPRDTPQQIAIIF